MKALRAALGTIRTGIGGRELLWGAGMLLLWLGGERLYPGAGTTACGLVAIAVAMVR